MTTTRSLALLVVSLGLIMMILKFDGSVGRNLRAWDHPDTISPKYRDALQKSLRLQADQVGSIKACVDLYQQLRPGWSYPGQPVPRDIKALWEPIFAREGVTMEELETDYMGVLPLTVPYEDDPSVNTDWAPIVPTPAPAHFYCWCDKLNGVCNINQFCDTILTYNDTANHYNLPESTWTMGRNAMVYLGNRRRRVAKLERRTPESHYCFLDGDVLIAGTTKKDLQTRLLHEKETNKTVAFNYRGFSQGAEYMYSVHGNFLCFGGSPMDQYLPYSSIKDNNVHGWILSQTDLVMRANILEPFAFKIYNDIRTQNNNHDAYLNHREQEGIQELLQMQTEEGFSPGCYPPANNPLNINQHECTFNGHLLFSMSFNITHRLKQ